MRLVGPERACELQLRENLSGGLTPANLGHPPPVIPASPSAQSNLARYHPSRENWNLQDLFGIRLAPSLFIKFHQIHSTKKPVFASPEEFGLPALLLWAGQIQTPIIFCGGKTKSSCTLGSKLEGECQELNHLEKVF